ncbi:transcriptional regulator SplA domain-containing protein [Bacillus sp. FSL W8-0848]|uniref:transcriptional regulator SplA domain-containing protein n=1 Tax=Bacillus sp. FSL W8-0848 TaxID=2954634 RepID=UPI0030F95C56
MKKGDILYMKEKEARERDALSINEAEFVPHPKFDGEYALLLHENYHFLSQEDIPDGREK